MRKNFQCKTKQQYFRGSISSGVRDWLFHAGSFMQRLQEHGIKDARIEVLNQDWQFPEENERVLLNMRPRVYALIREVLIASGKDEWMFARTVFPPAALTGKLRQLRNLQTRSLGSVLFKDPALQRSEFEIYFDANKQQWTRRSLFFLQEKSLLLTEVFLPAMERFF